MCTIPYGRTGAHYPSMGAEVCTIPVWQGDCELYQYERTGVHCPGMGAEVCTVPVWEERCALSRYGGRLCTVPA